MGRLRTDREAGTTTKDLIDAAMDAALAKDAADATAATDLSIAQQAATALTEANQAVYNDLSTNGPAIYMSGEPVSYYLAAAAEPATYTLTPLRLA